MLLGFQGWAQLPTWVDDIAPLVHDHCAKCHHECGEGQYTIEVSQNDHRIIRQIIIE